jgi:ATP-binding cassette subfamily C protein PrsD
MGQIKPAQKNTLLKDAFRKVRRPIMGVIGISLVSNILMLTGPMFMMLVYDKVLSSKSVPSLIALSVLAIMLYAIYGVLESMRSKILARVGTTFDHSLAPRLFEGTLRLPLFMGPHSKKADPLQDLAIVRTYLMGSGPAAAFDLPWMPLYFVVLSLVHPVLGLAAFAGAVILVIIASINQYCSNGTSRVSNEKMAATNTILVDAKRNAEAVAAMSMGSDLCKHWGGDYVAATSNARQLADNSGFFSAVTKTFRFVLQSSMLAIGAYLVILDQISPGGMIASSIIMGRALAPVDQIIANWRGMGIGWQAYQRVKILTAALPEMLAQQHELPTPKRTLSIRDLAVVPPGSKAATLSGVSFEVEAGDAIGIIGPSGCGKSTLVRALVGAWTATRGEVKLDGAPIAQYSAKTLGRTIGHLPQNIEIFDGTIIDNIARFNKEATTEQVMAAAKLAGVHEMILSFPQGYETQVGEGGAALSGGQRQRIGLARALFGNPFMVVLDEPNSNLDPSGEQSLNEAIQRMRENGQIAVIVAHRPSAIFAANKILSLRNGRAEMFGPKNQVLAALFPRHGQPHKPHPVQGVTQDEALQHAVRNDTRRTAPVVSPGNVTAMYAEPQISTQDAPYLAPTEANVQQAARHGDQSPIQS